MKKLHLFLVATAILSCAFCKSVLATCPEGQVEDSTTGHCLITNTDCGEDCRWTYDTTTQAITFSGNGALSNPDGIYSGYKKTLKEEGMPISNIIVEEGFTSVGGYFFYASGGNSLLLPSTVRSVGYAALHNSGISEVDCESSDIEFDYLGLQDVANLTLMGSDNVRIYYQAFQGASPPPNTVVKCKGDKMLCERSLEGAQGFAQSHGRNITTEFYKDYDANGNIVEEWDANGKHEYKYTVDGAGNIVGKYKDGKLIYAKNIYTPAEAAAATKDGNNNTVSITW